MIDDMNETKPQPGFPPHGVDTPQRIMPTIELIPSPEPNTHIICYGPPDWVGRILIAFTLSLFAAVFGGSPLYFGIRDWPILLERPFEPAGLFAAGALLIGIIFLSFFGSKILWSLFGSTFFTASKRGLEIKKKFLFFTTRRFIKSDDIKCLRLHCKRLAGTGQGFNEAGHRGSNWYTLWVVGRKNYKLASKTPGYESVDWLSETLSEWFGVRCHRDRRSNREQSNREQSPPRIATGSKREVSRREKLSVIGGGAAGVFLGFLCAFLLFILVDHWLILTFPVFAFFGLIIGGLIGKKLASSL